MFESRKQKFVKVHFDKHEVRQVQTVNPNTKFVHACLCVRCLFLLVCVVVCCCCCCCYYCCWCGAFAAFINNNNFFLFRFLACKFQLFFFCSNYRLHLIFDTWLFAPKNNIYLFSRSLSLIRTHSKLVLFFAQLFRFIWTKCESQTKFALLVVVSLWYQVHNVNCIVQIKKQ